jgi:hypothetical protein
MRLYVPLDWQEFDVLQRLAYAERRRPQDQAAVILARALVGDRAEEQTASRREPESLAQRVTGEAESVPG